MSAEQKPPSGSERKAATTGLPMETVITPRDLPGFVPARDLGYPGDFPFSRGV